MRDLHRRKRMVLACVAGLMATIFSVAITPAAAQYKQTNLVSDVPNIAATTDTNCGGAESSPCLVNPWGIVASTTSPFWISDNGTGFSTLYTGTGVQIPLVVTIPTPNGGSGPAKPTGIVFNNTTDFVVTDGANSAPAAFIFATEDGTISGWSPTVDRTHAILQVDNSSPGGPNGLGLGAIYKGLANGYDGTRNLLFATNFRDGVVEVYDYDSVNQKLRFVKWFTDERITPDASGSGFAPFGIRNINGLLFVTFALQDADKEDDVAGPGLGFIDVFDMSGKQLTRFATGGPLNAPWGLAVAPGDFGRFSTRLLVGNFGDGRISAYDMFLGHGFFRLLRGLFRGQLRDSTGKPLAIDGLWGLTFGNGAAAGLTNELFFTAGIQDEAHGLFGKITAQ